MLTGEGGGDYNSVPVGKLVYWGSFTAGWEGIQMFHQATPKFQNDMSFLGLVSFSTEESDNLLYGGARNHHLLVI